MSSTTRHLIYALLWLAFFTFVVVIFTHGSKLEFGRMGFYAQVGSILWVMGFAGIFFSWARFDAPAHSKSINSAAAFAALWLFFNFLAHIAYLFFTRGIRNGTLAALRFICFLLASGTVWILLGRALHLVL